jgi:homoserine O-acetyltransferase
VVAYEEYGDPNSPVILIAHGGLSPAHAAGKYSENDAKPGWWDELIGSGKAYDTDKYRVLCSCSLGIGFGSTAPNSINPKTGCRYGPLFPDITLVDTVRYQKAFLDAMGVDRLHIMSGLSTGSLQTLQMASLYPGLVGAAIPVATSGRMTADGMAMHHFMINAMKMDPGYHGGWYDMDKELYSTRLVSQAMKIYYFHEKSITQLTWDVVPEGPDSQQQRSDNVLSYMTATSDIDWLKRDPNCIIKFIAAVNTHDLGRLAGGYENGVRQIQCPVLLMNVDTDREFAPHWAYEIADILNAAKPGQAEVRILESIWGHYGCALEPEQMSGHIREFMQREGL